MGKGKLKLVLVNTTWQRNLLIQNAARYFALKLGGFRNRNVTVTIMLDSTLRRKEKCRGMAHQNSKDNYIIKLARDLKTSALVNCLAHEFVHVNQWLSGQMEDVTGNRWRVRWGTRLYISGKLAYRNHPWEKQAYRMDKVLQHSFLEFWKGAK